MFATIMEMSERRGEGAATGAVLTVDESLCMVKTEERERDEEAARKAADGLFFELRREMGVRDDAYKRMTNCGHKPSSSVGEREKTEGWVAASRSMTGETERSILRALCGAVAEVNMEASG